MDAELPNASQVPQGQQLEGFPALASLDTAGYNQLLNELQGLRSIAAAAVAAGLSDTSQRGQQSTQQSSSVFNPVKPPKPDVFKGGRKVASWLFLLEQYFTVTAINDHVRRVHFAAALLRDTAADWWRGYLMASSASPPLRTPISTWEEFKTAITQHFQPIHEEDFARQHIRTLKQQGTVRDYVVKFQHLILQIPTMDERSRVDCFVAGLKMDVRRWVKLQDPRTLEDAMTIGERYQTMLMQDKATSRTYRVLGNESNDDKSTPMELGVLQGGRRGNNSASSKPNTVGACWRCGEPGHLKRDCPLRRDSKKTFSKGKGARVNAVSSREESSNA
jgi:hypothetical protein